MNMNQSTSVVGGLSEFKEETKPTEGILQRIEKAKTIEEVQELLKLGGTYKGASTGTLKKWSRAAGKRMNELGLK